MSENNDLKLEYTQAELDLKPEIIRFGDPKIVSRNLEIFAEHTHLEQSGQLDAALETIHRDNPFQIFTAGGLNVWGWENVREFYRERMTVFTGQTAYMHRMLVTEKYAVCNGWFKGAPNGKFFGHQTWGKPLLFPVTVWVYFKDGLVLGESGHWDGATVERQARAGAIGSVLTPIY